MSIDRIRLACMGAYGHTGSILAELKREEVPFELMGWAPAFAGEPSENFLGGASFQGVPRYADRDALLAEGPDWVIVGTRLDQTASAAADCLEAGAHVIAEKPLATRMEDLKMLHVAWKSSGRHLSAMLTMENEPVFRAARAAVREGRVGRVILVEARKSYKWGVRPEWFGDAAKYGGTFPWVGIHALNMIQFVTGSGFAEGSSRQANLGHPTHPGCEDVCVASLTLETGALASVTIDLARPQTADTYGDDWCRIVGTEGVIEANGSQGWCCLLAGSLKEMDLPPSGSRFAAAMRRAAEGELRPDDTMRAFHLTETSLLARDAAATGEVFRVADQPTWS